MSTPLSRSPEYSSDSLKFMNELEIPPVPKGYARAKKKSSKKSSNKKQAKTKSNWEK